MAGRTRKVPGEVGRRLLGTKVRVRRHHQVQEAIIIGVEKHRLCLEFACVPCQSRFVRFVRERSAALVSVEPDAVRTCEE